MTLFDIAPLVRPAMTSPLTEVLLAILCGVVVAFVLYMARLASKGFKDISALREAVAGLPATKYAPAVPGVIDAVRAHGTKIDTLALAVHEVQSDMVVVRSELTDVKREQQRVADQLAATGNGGPIPVPAQP